MDTGDKKRIREILVQAQLRGFRISPSDPTFDTDLVIITWLRDHDCAVPIASTTGTGEEVGLQSLTEKGEEYLLRLEEELG